MSRVAPSQPDLFAPPVAPAAPEPPRRPPLEELAEMLALLDGADRMPWDTLPPAMEWEAHARWLASQAGPAGADYVRRINDELERLFCEAEAAGRAM